jgi:hypothetical protein
MSISIPILALSIGGMLLNVFILPTIFNKDAKIPRSQSISYVFILGLFFTLPYLLLGMFIPALSTFIGAFLWTIVSLFRF